MANLKIHTDRIVGNIRKLSTYLNENNITWSLVTKMLNGNKVILEKILTDPTIKYTHSIGDARISNLKVIKDIRPDIVTMYIKPPAMNQVKNIIKYADISFNSTVRTLEALNAEAGRQGKKHRTVIMIELGELREGIMRDRLLDFYEKAFLLENLEIIGIGTNLGCMYGVEPTFDKLIQLSLYKQLVEMKFDKKLELVSSGSSITLPLVGMKKIPPGVNHFRIGEAAYLGISPYDGKRFKNLSTNVFDFSGEIIEIEKKEMIPDGNIGDGGVGHAAELDHDENVAAMSYRALVDFGSLDVDANDLTLKDSQVDFLGTTSDMTVYDIGKKKGEYKVGKRIQFRPNYMAVARLMNSKYITKEII